MPLIWEIVESGTRQPDGRVVRDAPTHRAKVPGGWLVRTKQGIVFLPDPEHRWDGSSLR